MKDYDTTLARIAGNIAAGLVSADPLEFTEDFVAARAVVIAERIVKMCKDKQAMNDNAKPNV